MALCINVVNAGIVFFYSLFASILDSLTWACSHWGKRVADSIMMKTSIYYIGVKKKEGGFCSNKRQIMPCGH